MLGVLMLDTHFPRPLGDVGHPGSFEMPVRYERVRGATASRVVRSDTEAALLAPFLEAGHRLIHQGACALTTSCGFLVRFQHALQAALPVPVWTSALLKLPELESPGVLTVNAQALGPDDLVAAGGTAFTPIEGLAPGCSLQRTLLQDLDHLDPVQAQADVVAAALRLVERCPQVKTLVLECTNMPPYAQAVAQATGRSVHHLMTLVHERWKLL